MIRNGCNAYGAGAYSYAYTYTYSIHTRVQCAETDKSAKWCREGTQKECYENNERAQRTEHWVQQRRIVMSVVKLSNAQ